jgi:predicted Zn-dependent protease
MSPRRAATLAALAALACAGPPQRFEDVNAPEGLVEVLPRAAQVEVDGRPLGAGAAAVAVPDRRRGYRIAVRAPGFEPAEVTVPGEALAGARVGVALRPLGFGAARPLDLDDPASLSDAAALLLRSGRAPEAAEYAARAAELAPAAPTPRRLLADAHLRAGRREDALREYAAYLVHAPPDAPDRARVEERVAALRGDLVLPPERK